VIAGVNNRPSSASWLTGLTLASAGELLLVAMLTADALTRIGARAGKCATIST
jgi:hypothetical protein